MSSVIVLCPNGHRVTVSVTPGTLLNQIKQQACEKQNYCITKYGLKQELSKKFLDLSTPFRLSGLSNRAKLELHPQEQKSVEVNVAVQVEGGGRRQGKFSCDELLITIIKRLFPGITLDPSTTLLYMQRQITSAQISAMSLRDLGITQSAMLRLRGTSLPSDTAVNGGPVAGVSNGGPVAGVSNGGSVAGVSNGGPVAGVTLGGAAVPTVDPVVKKSKDGDQPAPVKVTENSSSVDEMAEVMAEKLVQQIQSIRDSEPGLSDVMEVDEVTNRSGAPLVSNRTGASLVSNRTGAPLVSNRTGAPLVSGTDRVASDTTPLLFSPQSKDYSEVDDKFFSLNQNDIRSVLSDLNKVQNPQFKFRSRESGESQYQQTVIRVRFPCGRVLQSFYSPNAMLGEVYDFVSSYVNSSDALQLYCGPPKQLLARDKTLHEMGLEPTALIHAGSAELRGEVSTVSEDQAVAQLSGSVFSAVSERAEPIVMDTEIKPEASKPKQSTSGKTKAPPKWFKMN